MTTLFLGNLGAIELLIILGILAAAMIGVVLMIYFITRGQKKK